MRSDTPRPPKTLLGVQLDDEVLLDRQIDVLPDRESNYLRLEAVPVEVQPFGNQQRAVVFHAGLELVQAAALLPQGDNLARLDQIGGRYRQRGCGGLPRRIPR